MAFHKSFSISGVRGGKNSNETLQPGIRAELKTPTGRQGTQGGHEALPVHFIRI